MGSEKDLSYTPLISVVIVNWNGIEDTKECLKHLNKQTYKNFETIVVDNGSSDGSLSYLKKLDGIILVQNHKNLGFTGGHIAGYAASKGDFILLLNNDAIMDPQYIGRAVAEMEKDNTIGAIGGRAYLWDDQNKLFDTTNSFYSYQNINPITGEGIFAKSDLGVAQEVNNVSGSCVMVRRDTIERIGYLHNPFFAYYEESDLFARMKRKGYKVIYHPELAIWHANAKSSNRKAPTFFYYMIMRNRFRFAVRNFDNWSLVRFLKFYFKMGIVSIIKSVLPIKQRPMHQAYSRAFLYNLVFGWKAVYERFKLARELADISYNNIIVSEKTGLSIVVTCNSTRHLDSILTFADKLRPLDELVIVSSSGEIEKRLKNNESLSKSIAFCADKGYFKTHQHNIGAVCAKNEWLILSVPDNIADTKNAYNRYLKNIYYIKRAGNNLALLSEAGSKKLTFRTALQSKVSHEILVNSRMFIDEGGLDKSLSLTNAMRKLIAYSTLANKTSRVSLSKVKTPLPAFAVNDLHELHKQLSAKLHQAKMEHKKPSIIDRASNRYYRLAQTRNLLTWLFDWRIPTRLKIGRIKNLVLGILKLNLRKIAIELKHMGNEVVLYKNAVNLVELKEKEQERAKYLQQHPLDTTIFIILRDRYQPLIKLLEWLEKQELKKIVLIDNDSKLPPLMDFLKKTNYQVLELHRNMTQTAPWSAGLIKVLLPDDFYIVTDPDIIPTNNSKGLLSYLYQIHLKYPYHLKVGLGLKIDDLPDHYPLKHHVIEWESQFWKHQLEEGVYEAGVDTTFAIYKPFTYNYILNPSLRTGEPYTARHLPWYSDNKSLSDEDIFYRLRADQSVNSWDKEHLPDRYKKELKKQH